VLLLAAWALSERRSNVPWRIIGVGLALEFALALAFLKLPGTQELFLALGDAVTALQAATRTGTSFVLGYLGGGPFPFAVTAPEATFILALQALPLVLVMSAVSAILFHWRVLPIIVGAFAWALERAFGIGGAAGLSTAANVFVGQVEAPLLVRPYLAGASRADLFLIMTGGLATIAGTVMVLYAGFLQGIVPDPIGHMLTASVMNAPAAIIISRLMVPADPGTREPPAKLGRTYDSTMDAITRGTLDGVALLINISAMLIVLVALVALANLALGLLPDAWGAPVTLQRLLGCALAPLAWLMGIPWAEAVTAGGLLGTKIVLNELIAYLDFSRLPADALGAQSRLIMTYALCSFANFGSLGIMIGGLAVIAPERRGEVVALGLKSIVAGTLATCLTAAVVGLL
jgi:CNT family concentrative nucleoside transporter